jgi:hypothetical protein
VSGSHSVVL